MRPTSRPCFTSDFVAEMRKFQRSIEQRAKHDIENGKHDGLRFHVIASNIPGVFNLGGDLALFLKLIHAGDRDGLLQYMKACIEVVHVTSSLPITTIALVQGEALGGGFEAALAARILIAERRARMGLPEILFNLFPGMGAYSLLARKLDPARAERLILSGRIYSAEELYQMGVVDVLAEDGQGEEAAVAYMKKHVRAHNGYEAMHKIRQAYHSISYDELMHIGTMWVDAALHLGDRDLRIMERIARTQEKLAILRPVIAEQQLA
jgi:DSF synthase